MSLQLGPPSKCQANVLVITHLTLDSTLNLTTVDGQQLSNFQNSVLKTSPINLSQLLEIMTRYIVPVLNISLLLPDIPLLDGELKICFSARISYTSSTFLKYKNLSLNVKA
jgi:hypothetical protein